MQKTLPTISDEQARWFKMNNNGLIHGKSSITEIAADLGGIQAQINTAAWLALWNRLSKQTDLTTIQNEIYEKRSLVRLTGQRGTLHLYTPNDMATIVATVGQQEVEKVERRTTKGIAGDAKDSQSKRREGSRDIVTLKETCQELLRILKENRSDDGSIMKVSKNDLVDLGFDKRLAYGAFACLCAKGEAVRVEMGDNGTPEIVSVERWLPTLSFQPASDPAVEVARRYFNAYAPATERDFRYWLGTKAGVTKAAIEKLIKFEELTEVSVAGQTRLVPTNRLQELQQPAPSQEEWPIKLLYRFDPMMLSHQDKSEWLPEKEHQKKIWYSTHVQPVVLIHGKIHGSWKWTRTAKGLSIELIPFVTPFSSVQMTVIEQEIKKIAEFLKLPLLKITLTAP